MPRIRVLLSTAIAICGILLAACTSNETQLDRDYSAIAKLKPDSDLAIPEHTAREMEARMHSREITDAVLARMNERARRKLVEPHAEQLSKAPTNDDLRALLQFGLNILPPQNGNTFLIIFRHPDPNVAIFATQLFAEEIIAKISPPTNAAATAANNATATENKTPETTPKPPAFPALTLQGRARLFIIPANAIPNAL